MRKKGWLIFVILLSIFAANFAYSAPIEDNLHLNIQLLNSSGDIVTGTFNFVFNISTSSDCANVVYTNFTSLTADSRGIISYYLENTGLDYSQQYWLCYYRNGVLINSSKLARSPYAFTSRNVSLSGIIIDSNLNLGSYNVTTTGTGFFSWLGSLASRINSLFIQNINFNGTISGTGNINTSGNITGGYLIGSGQYLTGISLNSSYNATYDSYYFGARNETLDTYNNWNTAWLSTYNSTYAGLVSDNSSWNESRANTLYAPYGATSGNMSWNQSYANTLYYGISNPSNFFNASNYQSYNSTYAGYASNVSRNWTLDTYNNWNTIWSSTYNSTYAAYTPGNLSFNQSLTDTLYAPYGATSGNLSWNESRANTLYAPIGSTSGNMSWNQSLANTLYYGISNPFNFWNSTSNGFNKTYADTLYAPNTTAGIQSLINGSNVNFGSADFNGGFSGGNGVSILGGNIWAKTIYVYNLSSVNVNNMNVNGSLFPSLNSTFDIGSSSLKWKDAYFSGTIYINNGTDISTSLGNSSWNELRANTLYYGISNPSNFFNASNYQSYNSTYAGYSFGARNETLDTYNNWNTIWSSTYNSTYAAYTPGNLSFNQSLTDTLYAPYGATSGNLSWNESRANTLYAPIGTTSGNMSWNQSYANTLYYGISNPSNFFNASNYQSYNSTYAGYASNVSRNWTLDTYNNWNTIWSSTYNSTYAGLVADNSTWNESRANTLYAPIGTTSGNMSWNQSYANTLYYGISNPSNFFNASNYQSYNSTYAGYASNVSRNWTLDTYNNWNTIWSSTYNSTYAGLVADNSTWNESRANTLYAPIGTTSGNMSWNQSYANTLYYGISNPSNFFNASNYQSYNSTYAGYASNVSRNWTLDTYNNWNTIWSSTYNSTYAAYTPGNLSFNQSYANTLYYGISNPFNFWNSTSNGFNKTYADTLYAPISISGSFFWLNNSNQIYLSSSAPNYVNISNSLFINGTNNNVGIGTSTPGEKLTVVGNINASDICISGGICLSQAGMSNGSISGSGNQYYLARFTGTSVLSNSLIYDDGAKIGIGTATPSQTLDVRGIGNFSGTIYINNGTDISASLGNSSWNESRANTLYYKISNPFNFWNSTSNGFNKTYADTLYAPIGTTSGNMSWNQSYANTLYYGISNPSNFFNASNYQSYNSTYAGYASNVSRNWTLDTYNNWNTIWSSTYNSTYAGLVADNSTWNESRANTLYAPIGTTSGNMSWNQSYANTLYYGISNPSNFFNASNYQSYNSTYAGLINNASYLSTYNSSYVPYTGATNNIALNGHYLSGDGGNEGINISSDGWTTVNGQRTGTWNKILNVFSPVSPGDAVQFLFGRDTSASYNSGEMNFHYVGSGDPTNYFTFGLYGNAQTLVVAGTDNVGIGITNPGEKLYVAGRINSTVDVCVTGGNCLSKNWTSDTYNAYNSIWSSTYNATYASYTADNSSWNQSYANTLYYGISNPSNFFNASNYQSYNSTYAGLINNASYLSTYNATYDSYASNVSRNWTLDTYNNWNTIWSSTYNSTYAGLINNASYLSTYNATYDSYASNVSRNWTLDTYNNWNTIWSSTYNSTYAAYTADNSSWNQSLANTLYYGISNPSNFFNASNYQSYNSTYAGLINNASYLSTYNATYDSYASNVSRNWTLDTYNNWNTIWSSTYNATYAGLVSYNSSWNESRANTLYYGISNPSNFFNASNYQSYNSTYAGYASNVSRNWTLDTYNNWNTIWSSTYNATYAGLVSYNSSWNESRANTLYYGISNPFNFWNSTSNGFNKTYADTLYSPINYSGNPFNQILNITSNVTFNNLTLTGVLSSLNFKTDLTNVSVGNSAGNNAGGEKGDYLTAVGSFAGYQNEGMESSFFGYHSGYQNLQDYVTAIGNNAGSNNGQYYLTAVGYYAGDHNSGADVTSIGANAGQYNQGHYLTAVGYTAGENNNGTGLTAFGYGAGFSNIGTYDIGIGYSALNYNKGNNTIAIGYQAGMYNNLSNQFIVKQANINSIPLIQGNFSSGNVGIGTATPSEKLTVAGNINATSNNITSIKCLKFDDGSVIGPAGC